MNHFKPLQFFGFATSGDLSCYLELSDPGSSKGGLRPHLLFHIKLVHTYKIPAEDFALPVSLKTNPFLELGFTVPFLIALFDCT